MKIRHNGASLWATLTLGIAGMALIFGLISSVGSDMNTAWTGFIRGIFGSTYAMSEVLVKAIPLILCGLGIAVGFHCGFVNIGAEGQFYMGAVVVTALGTRFSGLHPVIGMGFAFIGGFLAAGLWALIPGLLKAKWGLSEAINTIMFNYIATGIVGVLLQTGLKDPSGYFPQSPILSAGFELPILVPKTRLHAGILIALVCAGLIYLLIYRSEPGFALRAVGSNAQVGRSCGLPVTGSIILAALISGGLAGLAGVCEVAGLQHRLMEGISPGYGYLAIIVALLGKNTSKGIVLSAIGIAALQVGAQGMQRSAGIPTAIADIIMGIIVLALLAYPMVKRSFERRKR